MQAEMERLDTRFKRFFILFNMGWMFISICSLSFSFIDALIDHPEYLHEWRGPAMLVLTLFIPGIFGYLLLRGHIRNKGGKSWPPPRSVSLLFWSSLYLAVTLLNVLDNNFVWNYFTVLGITYSIFEARRMLLPVILIFLSYCYFLNYLSWSLLKNNWGAMAGSGITFFALTIVCITI